MLKRNLRVRLGYKYGTDSKVTPFTPQRALGVAKSALSEANALGYLSPHGLQACEALHIRGSRECSGPQASPLPPGK